MTHDNNSSHRHNHKNHKQNINGNNIKKKQTKKHLKQELTCFYTIQDLSTSKLEEIHTKIMTIDSWDAFVKRQCKSAQMSKTLKNYALKASLFTSIQYVNYQNGCTIVLL